VEAFVPVTKDRIEEKENWVGSNDEWIVMVKLNTIWHLRNIYTMEEIPVESVENTGNVVGGIQVPLLDGGNESPEGPDCRQAI
jgi:hypothetical protein